MIASVEAVPVAVVVTTVAHAPEAMALVPRAEVPLAIVVVPVSVVQEACIVPPPGVPAVRTCPFVGSVVGKRIVEVDPAAAGTEIAALPLLEPFRVTLPEVPEPTPVLTVPAVEKLPLESRVPRPPTNAPPLLTWISFVEPPAVAEAHAPLVPST